MPATATKTNIKPLADKVVILIEAETNAQTPGGIIIPDSAKEKPQRGTVLAIGPGKTLENGQREAMTVKVGDVVLFQKYGGTDMKMDGMELKILSERDILGIIEA